MFSIYKLIYQPELTVEAKKTIMTFLMKTFIHQQEIGSNFFNWKARLQFVL